MSKIILLPEQLANKIAAGEVVERPASVVKELVENAIDAKSDRIIISLLEGGVQKIEVCDNGEGLSREDALLAFSRHATSKLSKEEDLSTLATLGFRGEALPSIASISHLRLVTKTFDCDEGTEITLAGGVIEKTGGVGVPTGSTFCVSDLFFNTPARKKFLKSTETELGHISQTVFQLAVSHPQIDFQLTHEKRKLLNLPTVSSQKDRLSQLYGEAVMSQVMEANAAFPEAGILIHAFFSKAPILKNHRKDQLFFVNRRCIKNQTLSHALYEGYGSFLMKGEHPFCILFLSIDPNRVDVNVHPTKKEVRFENADVVYRTVKNLIRQTLSGNGQQIFRESGTSAVDRQGVFQKGQASGTESATLQTRQPASLETHAPRFENKMASVGTPSTWIGWPAPTQEIKVHDQNNPTISFFGEKQSQPLFELADALPLIRPIGQVYGTFLLADVNGEFIVVDQHAAHERILYESFLKKKRREIQPLLIPRPVDLSLPHAAFILEALPLLEEIGFQIEAFGENTFLIRAVPLELVRMDMDAFLSDLAEDLSETGVVADCEGPLQKIFASMACHSAIRANQKLSLDEVSAVLTDYFGRNTPPTCPHGRPVIIKYPLLDLEKMFRRK
ncbi:MAG: DNA mismatch repair endonuclease MutL [Nitrospirota bacterium]